MNKMPRRERKFKPFAKAKADPLRQRLGRESQINLKHGNAIEVRIHCSVAVLGQLSDRLGRKAGASLILVANKLDLPSHVQITEASHNSTQNVRVKIG